VCEVVSKGFQVSDTLQELRKRFSTQEATCKSKLVVFEGCGSRAEAGSCVRSSMERLSFLSDLRDGKDMKALKNKRVLQHSAK